MPHGRHVEIPASLSQLPQQPVTDGAEGQRWSQERIGAGAHLAALDVLSQAPVEVVTALSALPDLPLQVGAAVAHDRL
jgi:hypothetical protein